MESQYKSQLKSIVLDLRHILEGHYNNAGVWNPGDLEERLAALGVRRDREAMPLEQLSHLSEEDHRARQIVDAFIQSRLKSGQARGEAIHEFLQEGAYTWVNRLIALRCMEARGMIDEIILQKENYGGRSLKHHRLARQNPELCAGEDDGLYAVLFGEFADRAVELPLLFHSDEPVIALKPGVAALKSCIQLLSAPDEIFTAADALGWAYQYWNTEEKDRVFEKVRTVKGAKIEKLDIIPVTQLYTEPYMVKFLVQNSLGALWMAMHPDSRLCESWAYYVRDADRAPVERKPLERLSFLDPCVGSGHFHLEAFDLLYVMYQEEGKLKSPAEICEAILSHNLYGIDIDERAIQIAALALYMKAKEKDRDFRPKRINLVATNVHPDAEMDHLTAFLAKHPEDEPLRNTLRLIFDSLRHADELGTLLQIEEAVEREFRFLKALDDEDKTRPTSQTILFQEMEKQEQSQLPLGVQSYEEWKEKLLARLNAHFQEEFASPDFSSRFFGETAGKGLSLFDFLSHRYDVVATNPPYMGSKNMGGVVKCYVEEHFPSGKRDLYAAFILRCLELAHPDTGRVAMVTQQSWMFLRSFADLRALDEEKLRKATGFKGILRETSIEILSHLGPSAFGEISGEVVSIVLCILAKNPPAADHHLTAFRLIGPKSPEEKDELLLKTITDCNDTVYNRVQQALFLRIPSSPTTYWVAEKFINLISYNKKLKDYAEVKQGIVTGDNNRYLRSTWEVPHKISPEWHIYSKGGGYRRWRGYETMRIRWPHAKPKIAMTSIGRIRDDSFFGKNGWTYSLIASGSLSVRRIEPEYLYDNISLVVFPQRGVSIENVGAFLNSRLASYLLRLLSQSFCFNGCYVEALPLIALSGRLEELIKLCEAMKTGLIGQYLTEHRFNGVFRSINDSSTAILHTIEWISEKIVMKMHGLDYKDEDIIFDETGTPAGWFPLIQGYDVLPPLPEGLPAVPLEVIEFLETHDRRAFALQELEALKQRLRSLYEAGPGAKEEKYGADGETKDSEDDENDQIAIGARIPIPAETFMEELSQKLEIHPISVYWLLEEGIEKNGWHCISEEQSLMKDRFTVLILRFLGHLWPKQIESGEANPGWADDDGIIPVMGGTDESTLYARLRDRLAADYGDEKVSSEENAFEDVMGKPLSEWVRNDFFRHHISQFKKRPIAWHLTGARWTRRPRQEAAFECFAYYHKTDGNLLPQIRSHYIGPLLKRLELELRGLENGNAAGLTGEQVSRKDFLRERIPELKTFDRILSDVIATGFGPENMKSMLRQYAVNDAMLCLKARWLKKLSGVIQVGPLADWQQQADQTGLHADFSTWISDAIAHLDHHCHVVGPKPPEEKTLDTDPTSKELAGMICAEAEAMLTDALKCACAVWWKSFDSQVLKPVSEKIRDAKKELQSLKEQSQYPESDVNVLAEIKRSIAILKSDIKVWQNELALKTGQGRSVRDAIESWRCPEALTWEPWLAGQEMYDQLSSLNAKRPPPRTIREFVQQESLYFPDINDGVRVNIAPLQMTGLLAADVLAGKDADKAIADRASWRDDERRWCREGKLPKPGWWE